MSIHCGYQLNDALTPVFRYVACFFLILLRGSGRENVVSKSFLCLNNANNSVNSVNCVPKSNKVTRTYLSSADNLVLGESRLLYFLNSFQIKQDRMNNPVWFKSFRIDWFDGNENRWVDDIQSSPSHCIQVSNAINASHQVYGTHSNRPFQSR